MSSIDDIFRELRRMYKPEFDGTGAGLESPTSSDIRRWSNELGVKPIAVYDTIALLLAEGFHRRELTFEFCDAVMNDVFSVAVAAIDEWGEWKETFWSVYLAFDEGEYCHNQNHAEDPVETYTRPMIAEIVAKHGQEMR